MVGKGFWSELYYNKKQQQILVTIWGFRVLKASVALLGKDGWSCECHRHTVSVPTWTQEDMQF